MSPRFHLCRPQDRQPLQYDKGLRLWEKRHSDSHVRTWSTPGGCCQYDSQVGGPVIRLAQGMLGPRQHGDAVGRARALHLSSPPRTMRHRALQLPPPHLIMKQLQMRGGDVIFILNRTAYEMSYTNWETQMEVLFVLLS